MKPLSKTPTKTPGISKIVWPTGKVTYRATAPWWVDSAGKRHNPSKVCATYTEAKIWRAARTTDASERGIKRPTGRLTVGEYLDSWIADYMTRNPGNTAASYRRGLAKLADLPIRRVRLADLDRVTVKKTYDAIVAKALPHVHDALHLALNEAVDEHLIGRNAATAAMKGRKQERAERIVWQEDEYRRWLAVAAEDQLGPLWRVLGQTGARRGEILGLEWSDFADKAGTVTIRRQFTVEDGRHALKSPKTEGGERTIDLDVETIALLIDWRRRQAVRRLGRDARAMFTYRDGSRVGPGRALNDRFQAIVAKAGVRRLTIHDVRHTHATLLLRAGVPVHVVSRRLGHSNPAITLQVYAHVLGDQGSAAATVAGRIAGS